MNAMHNEMKRTSVLVQLYMAKVVESTINPIKEYQNSQGTVAYIFVLAVEVASSIAIKALTSYSGRRDSKNPPYLSFKMVFVASLPGARTTV